MRCDAVQEPRSFKIRMPEAEAGVLSLVLDQSEQAAFRVADPFLLSQSTGVCQINRHTARDRFLLYI